MFSSCFGIAVTGKAETADSYRKAAEQGDAKAQFNLGVMLYEGRGLAKDQKEAVRWYRKAAEHGYAGAKAAMERILQRR